MKSRRLDFTFAVALR